jgi:hypothetical protein
MRKFVAAALAAVAIPLAALPALAVPVVNGEYSVKGWNAGTKTSGLPSYTGKMVFRDMGGWYQVKWTSTAFKGEAKGVGYLKSVADKWVLAVGYLAGKEPTVCLYTVSDDGKTLAGDWVENGVGHEVAHK